MPRSSRPVKKIFRSWGIGTIIFTVVWNLIADVAKDVITNTLAKFFEEGNRMTRVLLWLIDHPWQVSLYFAILWAVVIVYVYFRGETTDKAGVAVGSIKAQNVVLGNQEIHNNQILTVPFALTT
jgi:hypothetical protein